jgi:uncharacterized protein (DUF924 family)
MTWINTVHKFWFEDLRPNDWFGGGRRIDAAIRERFGGLRDDLKKSPPSIEQLDSRGLVAAVIVFDQFSRNLFRNSAEAFATDYMKSNLSLLKLAGAIRPEHFSQLADAHG